MVSDMLRQTRNALIYADLAFFLLDTRQGINYNDVALYKWLTHQNELKALSKSKSERKNSKREQSDHQHAEVTVEFTDQNGQKLQSATQPTNSEKEQYVNRIIEQEQFDSENVSQSEFIQNQEGARGGSIADKYTKKRQMRDMQLEENKLKKEEI